MARIRTIKPDFWTDEKLSECSVSARLLFIGLISFADDEGRMEYHPTRVRLQVFPCGTVPVKSLMEWVGELSERSLIRLYCVDSKHYLCIPGFKKHQRINRPTPSRLPAYEPQFSESSVSPTAGTGTGTGEKSIDAPRLTLDESRGNDGSGFEKFWAAYPKKVEKKDAQRVWKSKRLEPKADALIADVKRRVAEHRPWLEGFVLHPTTYLNGERWNDAIEPVKPLNGHASAGELAVKARKQITDLATMFKLTQGADESWQDFAGRVSDRNTARLATLRATG